MLGALAARPGPVVVSAVEHPAVIEAAAASGQEVRVAPVGRDGLLDLDALRLLLDREVALVSVQLANHETGVIQPLAEIARLVRRRAPRAVLHTDAVQAAAVARPGRRGRATPTWSPSAATSSAAPRGSARWPARRRPALRAISTAAVRSASCAAAPTTWPGSSAWGWPWPRRRRRDRAGRDRRPAPARRPGRAG